MRRIRLAVPLLALFALASFAYADEPQRVPATAAATADVSQGSAGLQVAIDPVTGQLRLPTPEEAKVLAEGLRSILNDSSEGLEAVELPGGGVAIDLEERFQNVFVAFTQIEGDLAHQCLSSPAQVDGVVAAATGKTGAKE